MLVLMAGVTSAYALNEILEIPATIEIFTPVSNTYWTSSKSSFSFPTVASGCTSTPVEVTVTNDSSEPQILEITSSLPSDMHLMVFKNGNLYTPTSIPAHGSINLTISIVIDDGAIDRVVGFSILFSSL